MSVPESRVLRSTECFCGLTFKRGEDKASHCKTCDLYQKFKSEYLTYEKVNNYLNIKRYTRIELFQLYPYNMFCYTEFLKFLKEQKIKCPVYIICKDGSRLTLDEIKSILNYDYLYQKYIIEKMDAIDICHELHNKFIPWTILEYLKRYGIPRRNPSDATKNSISKMQKTCLDKFGVENVSCLKEIKDKKVQTTLVHYGTKHHLQNNGILNNMKKTLMNKYGVSNCSQINDVKLKKIETLKTHNDNGVTYSKISVDLFNKISQNFPKIKDSFRYATHGSEIQLYNNKLLCSVDFSCVLKGKKLAIEFNGDIWHANPKLYKETDTPLIDNNRTSKEIWNHDDKRYKLINDNGYQLLVVWESDYKSDPDRVLKECCDFIRINLNKN